MGVSFPCLSSLFLCGDSFSGQCPRSFQACLKLHAWISEQLRTGQRALTFSVQDVLTAPAVIQVPAEKNLTQDLGSFGPWPDIWGNFKSSCTRPEVSGPAKGNQQHFYWPRFAATEIGGSWTTASDQQAHLKFNIQEVILRGGRNGRRNWNFMQFSATLTNNSFSQKQ